MVLASPAGVNGKQAEIISGTEFICISWFPENVLHESIQ